MMFRVVNKTIGLYSKLFKLRQRIYNSRMLLKFETQSQN